MAEGRAVYAYVDGMNLYCGALKHNPGYKWLDVSLLMANLVSDFTIAHTGTTLRLSRRRSTETLVQAGSGFI